MVVPVVWRGSSLPPRPHLSPLRIGGKGAFCPACEGWGCLYPSMHPQAGMCPTDPGQHPLTREAQTRQVAVEVLQDQQVLVALDQFGHGNNLVIDWKARGERGPPLASVTPCRGSAWAELAALVGAAHPLYPGRLIPVGTSLVPQHCHTHCMGWKKFFPPTSRHVFRCKRARGSGCQIPGGRSGRVQGAAVVLPPPQSRPRAAARALPCTRVELCRKTWMLVVFLTTHVSFLWGREVRWGKYLPPDCPNQTRGIQNSSQAAEPK